MEARKVQNKIMMVYLKVSRYDPEGQEALTNIPDKKKDGNEEREKFVRSWAYSVKWTLMWYIGTNIWDKSCCVLLITLSVSS